MSLAALSSCSNVVYGELEVKRGTVGMIEGKVVELDDGGVGISGYAHEAGHLVAPSIRARYRVAPESLTALRTYASDKPGTAVDLFFGYKTIQKGAYKTVITIPGQ